MYYRVVTHIKITQRTQILGTKTRNKVLDFDFVNEFECSDSWRDFTNDGKITLPKNLYYRDANGKLQSLYGTNKNIGGFSTDSPILMRGDKITIDWGYRYFKNGREILEGTESATDHLFEGFISEITSKKPIEFKVEDNFWLLKQTQAPIKTYPSTMTLEQIVSDLVKELPQIKVNKTTTTTGLGQFMTGHETVAEVLGRLRKTYHFESYFRGDTLYCGSQVYTPLGNVPTHTFTFQWDIIEDDLQYKRKDDIVLSILASNKIEEATGKTTKDGKAKTKHTRIEVLVTLSNGSDTPIVKIITKDNPASPNDGGERMTMQYPMAKNITELTKLAVDEIKKYYYTGFKGKFTTFGIPVVRMGDNVKLVDPILPERNGTYKVKGVEYTGGINGLRQKIQLDYKIK